MDQKIQGIFLAIILLLGAASVPSLILNGTSGSNQAFGTGVGAEVETDMEVKVGSNDGSEDKSNDGSEDKSNDSNEVKEKSESKSDNESEAKEGYKFEIEVDVSGNQTSIKIKSNDVEKKFVLDTTSQAEIIAKIKSETSLSESEIKSIWKYHYESNTDTESSAKEKAKLEDEIEAKTEEMKNANIKAKERAKILFSSVENTTEKEDHRLHGIIADAKEKGYLNNFNSTNSSASSYNLSLEGMAISNTKTDSSLNGTLYLESMIQGSHVFKYRVPAGQIIIDGEKYDILFGKARAISVNNANAETNMILIAEIMKPNGEITTLKMFLQSNSSINSQTESMTWSVLNPQSTIAGEWKLDANAKMSIATA